jgi:hypothetical protein
MIYKCLACTHSGSSVRCITEARAPFVLFLALALALAPIVVVILPDPFEKLANTLTGLLQGRCMNGAKKGCDQWGMAQGDDTRRDGQGRVVGQRAQG